MEAQRETLSGTSLGGHLEARNLHFQFDKREVLRGVNLVLEPGEVVSLLGANGAGKTTLLRLLLGLASPAQGEVLIDGTPLASLSRHQIALRVAYVPQVHMTPFPYTVREVVTMGRLPKRGLLSSPSELDHDVVRTVLKKLEIWHLVDRVYSGISGGERQLVLIARALAQEARTLILDEPLANLDFGYQAVLAQHLKELAKDGHTILMTGHDPQFAYHASSRVALLIGGRLEQDGPPQQVLTSVTMQRLYGIDVECISLSENRVAIFPRGAS
ncbi:ABC transporter ATP-binding protein [Hyphomicrobium sp.]|uniref:ABC transporter ATP-binding protein n=1 Tax=Hyphomicrobium sp. TaxID=82 RepID=UPI001DF08467|nr:ABC transporter ATP-binding protein [Hyphomicrobium sp.]MBY0559778.1 ABC transporter ATP-binding protein [Hyphomicrobium sp.]